MSAHKHIWVFEDEWTDEDPAGRLNHFKSYRCKYPGCPIHKIDLEETTKFSYEIDHSEIWEGIE